MLFRGEPRRHAESITWLRHTRDGRKAPSFRAARREESRHQNSAVLGVEIPREYARNDKTRRCDGEKAQQRFSEQRYSAKHLHRKVPPLAHGDPSRSTAQL